MGRFLDEKKDVVKIPFLSVCQEQAYTFPFQEPSKEKPKASQQLWHMWPGLQTKEKQEA
jgi:hypothetical protein